MYCLLSAVYLLFYRVTCFIYSQESGRYWIISAEDREVTTRTVIQCRPMYSLRKAVARQAWANNIPGGQCQSNTNKDDFVCTQREGAYLRYRPWMILTLIIVLLASASAGFFWHNNGTAHAAVSASGLHVSGNKLLNSAGQVVRPLGINRSGTEYYCDSTGVTSAFDGPSDAASVSAMLTWNVNTIRLPLNEDCWLGINGFPANGRTAAQYQSDIVNWVNLLNSNGQIVILDLHWNNSGTNQSTGQEPMPDLDHAPAFWTSVANTFKSNSSVIFDLYQRAISRLQQFDYHWLVVLEKRQHSRQTSPCADVGFAVAGMQTLVNTVRATGATNVIMLGGLAYSNDISQWLANKPTDSQNNLVASVHIYNFNLFEQQLLGLADCAGGRSSASAGR